MGPLIQQGILSPEWDMIIAFIIGLGFGFVLEQAGFSTARKIVGVFYGFDMTVLRVFLTAVVTATIGLLYFNYLGWIDLSLIYINPTFIWSAIVGGILVGLGMIVGGYCPGTSFAAATIGKIDGMVFIGGLFIGVFFYGETYIWLFKTLHDAGNLGPVTLYDFLGISSGTLEFFFLLFAIFMFWMTIVITKKFANRKYKY
ncbi:MAG: YeeE/YedE thiosulfate transporter family protein [Bacteroidales bacterium]